MPLRYAARHKIEIERLGNEVQKLPYTVEGHRDRR